MVEKGTAEEGKDMPIHASNLPEAKRLGDLHSVKSDIQFVVDLLNRLIAEQLKPDADRDNLAMRSYFSSALIAYRRAFGSGVRVDGGLRHKDAEGLENNIDGFHTYLVGQADKLIAHSVNPFEQVRAGVLLRDGKVAGSGQINAMLVSMSDAELRHWGRLTVEVFEKVLKPRILAADRELYEAAAKLPIEEITKMPLLSVRAGTQSKSDATKRRG